MGIIQVFLLMYVCVCIILIGLIYKIKRREKKNNFIIDIKVSIKLLNLTSSKLFIINNKGVHLKVSKCKAFHKALSSFNKFKTKLEKVKSNL